MQLRSVRRALVLALAALLAFAGFASADSVRTDGDAVLPGNQGLVDLGQVEPSAEVSAQVAFQLVCGSLGHVDAGQSVTLTYGSATVPLAGAVVSVTSGSTAPAPDGWTPDGEGCPFPAPVVDGGTASTVTLRAPTVPDVYLYTITYARTLTPVGAADGSALSALTAISFELEVVANTPPVLGVPGDLTVEGDTAGGWTADWSGVTAADAQDDPDPAPVCSPAAGEVLPLGTTDVTCSVVDAGGLSDVGTFAVEVVDTTAPSIAAHGDVAVGTSDATGAAVTFDTPAATDVVDPAPTVDCVPMSGSWFPVGSTAVTCTATDATGNAAETAFDVTVTHAPVQAASATWGEPVGAGTGLFVANRGRNLPVKVTLVVDGQERATGSAALRVEPCAGGVGLDLALTYGGGRWNAALDTARLAGDCHRVSAWIDGLEAGSFTLELRGSDPAASKAPTKGRQR